MFNMAPTLRALTSGSPITTALHEARRMARRHLETGGAAVSAEAGQAGFVVPADIDPVGLAAAIEAKLRAGGNARSGWSGGGLTLRDRRPDGRVVVSRAVLERLGGGNADRGARFLERLIDEMRRLQADGRTAQSGALQRIVAAKALEQMLPAAAGFGATAS